LILPFCGSELAREGGLTADLILPDVHGPLVGVSLLAMATSQSTIIYRLDSIRVGAGLPAMATSKPTIPSLMYPVQMWERACSRKFSSRRHQTTCLSEAIPAIKHLQIPTFKLHDPLRHPGYSSLRRCLRVRQNPPAYTAIRLAISFLGH
jgi:hypothetical protein